MAEFAEQAAAGDPAGGGWPAGPEPEDPDVTKVDPIKPDVSVRRRDEEGKPID